MIGRKSVSNFCPSYQRNPSQIHCITLEPKIDQVLLVISMARLLYFNGHIMEIWSTGPPSNHIPERRVLASGYFRQIAPGFYFSSLSICISGGSAWSRTI